MNKVAPAVEHTSLPLLLRAPLEREARFPAELTDLMTSAIAVRYSSVMNRTVDAIYEEGRLVLQQLLPLPEHAHVRVIIDTDSEREAWLKLSEESLRKVWDNEADEVFNHLLQK